MNMRSALAAACLAIGFAVGGNLVSATAAQATTYNLTSDYSDSANPNGPWSYNYGGSVLPHQTGPSTANALNPAISAGGYFSTGSDLNTNTPDVLKAAVNGSSAGLTDEDFLAGDVVIHSPNDGTALSIVWTAPSAGTITDLAATFWYAHSSVDRSNDISLTLAGALLGSAVGISHSVDFDRDHAGGIGNVGPLSVNAGDLLSLSFMKTAGQTAGSLNGLTETFTFTAAATTPIPATLPLFASCLAGLGWLAHRRKQAAA